jgi:nucleoporin SEH1
VPATPSSSRGSSAEASVHAGTQPPTTPALCVDWAPNVGRRFHYVSAAHGDCLVVYKLRRQQGGGDDNPSASTKTTGSGPSGPATAVASDLTLESAQILRVPAWRCQWNVTGTVLASSGDGGSIFMHKIDHRTGQFELVSQIYPHSPRPS